MKKFISILIVMTVILSALTMPVSAQDNGIVMLVGNQQMLVGGQVVPVSSSSPVLYPYISNSRVLVPLRAVSEAFGAQVGWNGDTKTATIEYGSTTATIVKGESFIMVNGEQIALDAKSVIVYGSFFLPLRVVAENILGKSIEYIQLDTGDRVIVITDSPMDKASLESYAREGAHRINGAFDPDKNGMAEDGYYYINGRAYPVSKRATKQGGVCQAEGCSLCGQEIDLPVISFNWQVTEDYIIKEMVKNDFMSLMEPVEVDGQEIYVRREVAQEAQMILDEITDAGYVINSIHSHRLDSKDFASAIMASARGSEEGIMTTAFHPNGLAIDINHESNPMVYAGSDEYTAERELRYALTDPISPEIHFNGHIVAETFKKHGWEWGLWSSSSDYMHFSMGEY